MLVLSRKKDQSIIIECGGEIIEVVVVEVLGDKVRLGVTAPPHVPVNRAEVYARNLLALDNPIPNPLG